jgi:hypothetical protein
VVGALAPSLASSAELVYGGRAGRLMQKALQNAMLYGVIDEVAASVEVADRYIYSYLSNSYVFFGGMHRISRKMARTLMTILESG